MEEGVTPSKGGMLQTGESGGHGNKENESGEHH